LHLASDFQIFRGADRHHCPRHLPKSHRDGAFRLIRLPGRLPRLCHTSHGQGAVTWLRLKKNWMDYLHGRHIGGRNDHPQAQPRFVEQARGEVVGHPDATMGGWISRQGTTVERNA
jgi:hypothetical protein